MPLRLTRPHLLGAVTLLAALLVAVLAVGVINDDEPASAEIPTANAFDPDVLDPQPLWSAGVTNPASNPNRPYSLPALAAVWDFAEIGDRIFVGGLFPSVKETWNGPEIGQSFLAAFDRDSGDWISDWRPQLDDGVYALDVSPAGKLIVGGAFTQVNGTPRSGLVALDPVTGAVDGTFAASVERWWEPQAPIVRGLEVEGNDLYVVGNFDHVRVGANTYRVWSAARVRAGSGQLDPNFVPKVRYGAWDVAIDAPRGRVHLSGDFDSIDNDPAHAKHGIVSITDGSPVGGLAPHESNAPNEQVMSGVELVGGRVYVGGAQHITQVKSPGDNGRLGWLTWGLGCTTFVRSACGVSDFGGGDVQVIEAADGWALIGCHCWNRNGDPTRLHYSSFSGQRTGHRFIGIYDGASSALHPFVPALRERQFGTWALHVDANGCLYVGGDYTGASNGQWVGGFGKFCAETLAPQISGTSAAGEVTLSWSSPGSTGSLPIAEYKVFRDGTFIGSVSGATTQFVDQDPSGSQHAYVVEAVDSHGGKAASEARTVTVVAPPADTQDPSGPLGPDATTNSTSVTLTWNPSSDNVGVVGYLVHDNYQYLAYVPGAANTAYTHQGLGAGELHRYQVRAKDAAGNTSIPSVRLDVIVGDGVRVPDNLPLNVTPTQISPTSIEVEWDRPTNPGGITGYLVHDNYAYVAYVPGVDNHAYTHAGLTPNSTHQYEIRSQGNGVTSLPTERVRITLN